MRALWASEWAGRRRRAAPARYGSGGCDESGNWDAEGGKRAGKGAGRRGETRLSPPSRVVEVRFTTLFERLGALGTLGTLGR